MSNATFNQRKALHNMYTALGRSTTGIRDMTFEEASTAIDETQKYIKENGFPKDEPIESDGFGHSAGW